MYIALKVADGNNYSLDILYDLIQDGLVEKN